MVPRCAIQVTTLLVVVPCTVAENWSVPSVPIDGAAGEIFTELTVAVAVLMVTCAEADFVVSATLVAVTVAAPAVPGAVYSPDALIVPGEAFQVTEVFV